MHNFAIIPVLFGFGIASYFALPFEPNIWITLAVIEILITTAIVFRYYPKRLVVIGYIATFILGFCNVQLQTHYLAENQEIKSQEKLYIKGLVKYKDYNSRGNPRYTLVDVKDFDDRPVFNKIRVSVIDSDFVVGGCFETVASLMPPYSAPFYGAYDFSKKAFYSGLQANGYSVAQAYKTKCSKPTLSIVAKIRESIVAKINANINPAEARIAQALIAGEKGRIPQVTMQQYRDSGLAHVLSISGLHMSMIAGLMFVLIRTLLVLIPNFALKYDIKKISAFVAMGFATFYLLISGAQLPTQRAYIMVFIVLLGALFDRQAVSVKNICIAALIILITSPEAIVSPSFQMSFAAVLCLIAFYEKFALAINRFIKRFGFIIAYVLGLLIADFIASIATLPFAIYHFNKIALYTTLGNLLAGPIIGLVIMPFILLALIAMPVGLDALPLKIVGFGIKYMNEVASYVANMEGATVQVLSMPSWAFGMIICGGLWLCLLKGKIRALGLFAIAFGFLSLCFVAKPLSVNLEKPSKFNKMLVEQKYGNVTINQQKPYGAVIYKNKIKTLNENRIWQK